MTPRICNAPHQHHITSYFQLNKVLLTSPQTFRHIELPLLLLYGTGRHSLRTLLANLKFVCQFSPPLGLDFLGKRWPYDSAVRAKFSDSDAQIYAWPSRGSVIVLNSAEAMDFEFLGIDPLDPPVEHLDNQVTEDAFCQRLLLTGIKWWDGEARYLVVAQLEVSVMGDTRASTTRSAWISSPRL